MVGDERHALLTDALVERVRHGRDRRDALPLESHAELAPDAGRPDPIETLAAQDSNRLAELVPIRHERMHVSPFTFYRGAAAVMASDLASTPTTDLRVQLCGDAHLSNFGVFRGSDRQLVFDVNDFDETHPGPFEWDLKRLAASVTIAGRNNELSSKAIRAATRASVRGYRESLAATTTMSPLEVRYFHVGVEQLLEQDEKLRKDSERTIAQACRKDSVRAFEKLTEEVDGRRRIVSRPPLIVPLGSKADRTERELGMRFLSDYRSTLAPHRAVILDGYRVVDVAQKVVGVGSVGTRCLIVLLESDGGSPLFLQLKEAVPSVLERHTEVSACTNAGERVVRGQQLMQATGDILLGWARTHRDGQSTDFYVRQMWDGKGSVDVERMGPKRLRSYAWHCGATLALAHSRGGDGAAIHGYLGDDKTADHVFAEFAERYADRNERDYAAHALATTNGVL